MSNRGPKFTPPQVMRVPKGDDFISWAQSIDKQFERLKLVDEEIRKKLKNNNYEPRVKLSKKYQHYFDSEFEAIKNRKNKRKKHGKKRKK